MVNAQMSGLTSHTGTHHLYARLSLPSPDPPPHAPDPPIALDIVGLILGALGYYVGLSFLAWTLQRLRNRYPRNTLHFHVWTAVFVLLLAFGTLGPPYFAVKRYVETQKSRKQALEQYLGYCRELTNGDKDYAECAKYLQGSKNGSTTGPGSGQASVLIFVSISCVISLASMAIAMLPVWKQVWGKVKVHAGYSAVPLDEDVEAGLEMAGGVVAIEIESVEGDEGTRTPKIFRSSSSRDMG
ncbi:hypothetical protein BCR34DRAFT_151661 [Clohesyomyces aquaticus]|uniref:Uncharacterized protein n=1 Tax=Clohesyomyces aquaticus TaxID=1231657 RepID=A0A1Y1YJV5_9PLEO|nr:hypothetical protein BCR34DRAFT_151661 [Clohesyomyces aquaticus]